MAASPPSNCPHLAASPPSNCPRAAIRRLSELFPCTQTSQRGRPPRTAPQHTALCLCSGAAWRRAAPAQHARAPSRTRRLGRAPAPAHLFPLLIKVQLPAVVVAAPRVGRVLLHPQLEQLDVVGAAGATALLLLVGGAVVHHHVVQADDAGLAPPRPVQRLRRGGVGGRGGPVSRAGARACMVRPGARLLVGLLFRQVKGHARLARSLPPGTAVPGPHRAARHALCRQGGPTSWAGWFHRQLRRLCTLVSMNSPAGAVSALPHSQHTSAVG